MEKMTSRAFWRAAASAGCLLGILGSAAAVQADEAAAVKAATAADSAAKKADPRKKFPDWEEVTKGTEKLDGLFPLHYSSKEQKLFMEIAQNQFEKELILPISIARGAGWMFLGGDTLNFGNQWIISFRRVGERILVIRRNVQFKAKPGSPQADAVKVSYNDSVVSSLPIKSEMPGGAKVLIDLADLLMTDLANLGITPDRSRSTWAKVKAFPDNLEIEVSAVFSMGRGGYFFFGDESVPDPRGAQVVVHYGLSVLPESGYEPRVADDRVGHFLSVLKDYSTDNQKTPFVRYVTRWKLEKSDASADRSPPKEPIVFWVEKTVPREYRPYVRAGILEWNKAFDKIGFIEAIQVRDQQSSDDFDPEDIRFNTFRWITTSQSFAMGPSRTNPKTGQILDADIVFDESMVRFWRSDYLNMVGSPTGVELLRTGQRQPWLKIYASEVPFLIEHEAQLARWVSHPASTKAEAPASGTSGAWHRDRMSCRDCCFLGPGMSRQLGLMAAVLFADGKTPPGGKIPEEYIGQAIKEVVMHEVGHTLGLRHNFKASTMLSLDEIHKPEVTRVKGTSGSVMDYLPANFAPRGQKQGDYFSTTIGPYDYWAIEYAYTPIKGDESAELKKIAAKIAEPGLDYGTDEDLWSNPDPRINLFDLGDPLDFARQRAEFASSSLKDLSDRVVAEGEGWQRSRDAFAVLLGEISMSTSLAAQYIGAEYAHRDHKGDPNARLPFRNIPPAKQREAIAFLKDQILSGKAFVFSPELLKRLAPEHWDHWGMYGYAVGQPYNVYSRILGIQRIVLSRFLDSSVLRQIQESELRAEKGEETLRMPEVFDALTEAIWSELAIDGKSAEPSVAVSTARRNLQREHAQRLSNLVLGPKPRSAAFSFSGFFFEESGPVLPDARSLARFHLKRIDERIEGALSHQKAKIDDQTRAHLEELHDQIQKVLEAPLQRNEP